jgi:hypothetical protein
MALARLAATVAEGIKLISNGFNSFIRSTIRGSSTPTMYDTAQIASPREDSIARGVIFTKEAERIEIVAIHH